MKTKMSKKIMMVIKIRMMKAMVAIVKKITIIEAVRLKLTIQEKSLS